MRGSLLRDGILALIALGAAVVLAVLWLSGGEGDPREVGTQRVTAPPVTETAASPAAEPVEKAIWGADTLADGQSAFPIYKRLGVDVFQVQLVWADAAPTRPADSTNPDDPAYRWPATVDTAVREAREQGIQVAIMLRATPEWANGGQPERFAPDDPQDFADFATAAAKRYPAVRRWMIWGEPTRAGNFEPMPQNSPEGPRRYAELLDAAYGALKQADRDNIVIGGMTWTVGLVTPADFVRWMRLPDGRPPRLDWYGHNPYSTRFPNLAANPYVEGLRDINDIDTLHSELEQVYGNVKAPKLWLSEFSIASDRPNRAFAFSVSRAQQARWLTAAYALANSVDYVAGLGWFNLQDEDPAVSDGLTNGLMAYDGRPKPAFAAYRAVR